MLTRPLGIRTSFKDLAVYYFIGMFFNLFAPSTVGGDVSRVYYLAKGEANDRQKRASVSTAHAAISVLMDRAIGMVVLVWLGALGLLLFPNYAVPQAVRTATFLLALGLLLGAFAAIGQSNIKRLMAYSTIAHAGYMMMPVAAALALSSSNTAAAEAARISA